MECEDLKDLIKWGIITRKIETIDISQESNFSMEKVVVTYHFKGNGVLLKYCPCCGNKIQNTEMSDDECKIFEKKWVKND